MATSKERRRERIKRAADPLATADPAGNILAAFEDSRAEGIEQAIAGAVAGDRLTIHHVSCPVTVTPKGKCRCVPTALVVGARA